MTVSPKPPVGSTKVAELTDEQIDEEWNWTPDADEITRRRHFARALWKSFAALKFESEPLYRAPPAEQAREPLVWTTYATNKAAWAFADSDECSGRDANDVVLGFHAGAEFAIAAARALGRGSVDPAQEGG